MAKKKAKKNEPKIGKVSSSTATKEKYFQAVGRRKLSIARVRIFENLKIKEGKNDLEILINEKPYRQYFSLSELKELVKAPLKAVSPEGISKVTVVVRGGGIRGQAEAVRLGIARALAGKDGGLKKTLKDLGYLTRDARRVERKKAGLKKARRAPQFSKR